MHREGVVCMSTQRVCDWLSCGKTLKEKEIQACNTMNYLRGEKFCFFHQKAKELASAPPRMRERVLSWFAKYLTKEQITELRHTYLTN